jgi:hypothetical protein
LAACGDGGTTTDTHTHEWGEWQVTAAATCSAEGEEKRICLLDASHPETRTIAVNPDAHDWKQTSGTPATCTTAGSGSRTCNICGKVETGTLAALGHSYGNWVVNAAAGTEVRTCAHDSSHKETRDLTIAAFREWLVAQPDNNAATAYNVKLNINNLGGDYGTAGSLGNALYTNDYKYVNLDLSGSTFTSIGSGDFAHCTNLTNITIPASVTSIGNSVFNGCSSLTAITVDAGNTIFSSENGVLYNKDKTTLIRYPQRKTGAFTIPAGVTSIGSSAFQSCTSLTSVTIPNSVTSIVNYAFYGCDNLTSVIIGSGVTSIESNAFANCTSLTSVKFEGTIASGNLHNDAFGSYGASLGDLRAKYIAGGTGTYTRPNTSSDTWTKTS